RTLKMAGVGGPYAIALGPRCFTGLMQAMGPGGFPILEVVKHIVDGEVVWAPGVDGAVVLSTRGGDFELVVGRDLSIGYSSHDAAQVNLYVVESLTFRVLEPKAAVWLRFARGRDAHPALADRPRLHAGVARSERSSVGKRFGPARRPGAAGHRRGRTGPGGSGRGLTLQREHWPARRHRRPVDRPGGHRGDGALRMAAPLA